MVAPKIFISIFALAAVSLSAQPVKPDLQSSPPGVEYKPKWVSHKTAQWDIRPSFKLDLLCFLEVLTADSLYMDAYRAEYNRYSTETNRVEIGNALYNLERIIEDDNGNMISAMLCLYFSVTNDSTIDDLIATVADSRKLKENLKKTRYYSDREWSVYDSVRGDLAVIFRFLKDMHFDDYWRQNILPQEVARINYLKIILPGYGNVVPLTEGHLGQRLPSDTVKIYVLFYTQPHQLKITGKWIVTDITWPPKIAVRNAIHELMHPPYNVADSPELADAIESLKKDDFLMDKFLHRNPAYGYNTFEEFIEEDCVEALEQDVGEILWVSEDAHKRWLESDGGMHVFAVAVYHNLGGYNRSGLLFKNFLVWNIKKGRLGPGTIENSYNEFYPR